MLGTRDNHYDNMLRMYSNCSLVLENLEVTYTLEHHDLSFLQVCPRLRLPSFPRWLLARRLLLLAALGLFLLNTALRPKTVGHQCSLVESSSDA